MTVTLQTDEGRHLLRFERRLSHDPDRVWRAVTDPRELAEWFPSSVSYEPRVGAPMLFDFGGEHGLGTFPGEVLEWDPPRTFAFSWIGDVLRFELSPAEGGTLLVFTHAFDHEPGKPARDAAGWDACFEAFDALLGEARPDAAGDGFASRAAEYVERFGALTVADGDTERPLTLTGPYTEVEGRPAVNVALGEKPGVLVVRGEGQALADGVRVEVREGDVDSPGDVVLAGVLHDPLA